jgi:hypothetical protein
VIAYATHVHDDDCDDEKFDDGNENLKFLLMNQFDAAKRSIVVLDSDIEKRIHFAGGKRINNNLQNKCISKTGSDEKMKRESN